MIAALLVAALLTASSPSAAKISFSDIAPEKCRKIKQSAEGEGEFASFLCKAVAGYTLRVDYDDARDNLVVISPSGKRTDLHLWTAVGFSNLGDAVEWRLERGKPVALTVRYTIADPEDSTKKTSHLFVAKVTAAHTCVVARIDPGPKQNTLARAAAASASRKECLAMDG